MAKTKVDYDLTRVNMFLPSKLVKRVKQYSTDLGVPMTQGVILLLTKALDNENILEQLPMLLELYKEFQNKELENSDEIS